MRYHLYLWLMYNLQLFQGKHYRYTAFTRWYWHTKTVITDWLLAHPSYRLECWYRLNDLYWDTES